MIKNTSILPFNSDIGEKNKPLFNITTEAKNPLFDLSQTKRDDMEINCIQQVVTTNNNLNNAIAQTVIKKEDFGQSSVDKENNQNRGNQTT